MAQYIDKDAVLAEIERLRKNAWESFQKGNSTEKQYYLRYGVILDILSFIDTHEVKEVEECKQPEYSCFETTYKCGKKPHWNIGDMLAYYEFYSDREGERILGKVINVELDEEQGDWFYTFEDGSQYDEASLLEEETYKK